MIIEETDGSQGKLNDNKPTNEENIVNMQLCKQLKLEKVLAN